MPYMHRPPRQCVIAAALSGGLVAGSVYHGRCRLHIEHIDFSFAGADGPDSARNSGLAVGLSDLGRRILGARTLDGFSSFTTFPVQELGILVLLADPLFALNSNWSCTEVAMCY